jgi:preprotein translocase subunit SecD
MKGWVITGVLLAGLVVAATSASADRVTAASADPVTVTLTPKASASVDPKAAKALLETRLDNMGIDGTVKQHGEELVMTLPHGSGKFTVRQIVPPDVRLRPVLAILSRAADATADADLTAAVQHCDVAAVTAAPGVPVSTLADDQPQFCIVADSRATTSPQTRYLLGPAALVGTDLKSAKAQFQAQQGFVVIMNPTTAGTHKFNELAAQLYGQPSPKDQVAIVFDRWIESNPAFQAPSFSGPVQISGGARGFTRATAQDLAKVITFGASPLGAYEISHVTPG